MLIKAWVDGGARGNPGPAGYGVLLTDTEGHEIGRSWGYLGESTNNVAEYNALIRALELALDQKASELIVHTDSELVQRQVTGQYKVRKPHLVPLLRRVRELSAKLETFRIVHVRREENQQADALANDAMDRRESGQLIGAG